MKKLLLSSLLGGFAVFAWMALSWSVLNLHPTMKFRKDADVAKVLRDNALEHGVYTLPAQNCATEAEREATMSKINGGPFAFMMVRPGAHDVSMEMNIALSLLGQIACAFLVSSLLLCTRPMSYGARVYFVVQVALLAGLVCHLPPIVWWEMPLSWVGREFLDLAVAWTLGGLIIAKFANPTAVQTVAEKN